MSLQAIQTAVRQAFGIGAFSHVPRPDIEEKNWLYTGKLSRDEVIELLHACAAVNYSVSNHHAIPRIKVHEFKVHKTMQDHPTWYVKIYFQPDNPGQGWKVYSVHPST